MSREKVADEITAEIIEHIRELVCYWDSPIDLRMLLI